jgi:hypothetical protein
MEGTGAPCICSLLDLDKHKLARIVAETWSTESQKADNEITLGILVTTFCCSLKKATYMILILGI